MHAAGGMTAASGLRQSPVHPDDSFSEDLRAIYGVSEGDETFQGTSEIHRGSTLHQ